MGIDQGRLDSTSDKGRSSMAGLVKKRIVDGQFFKQTNNLYVAKYLGRSDDVRDDYEQILMLSMYYDAKVNLEYTKIGLASYFRECKQYHRLMSRPLVAMPSGGDGINIEFGIRKNTNLIGTPATTAVIDHQDGKIKEYIDDYYQHIFFVDILEQLRDYQREDRTEYDMVIAMGLCELADEDLLGLAAKPHIRETVNFVPWGYYMDSRGYRKYGPLPSNASKEQNILSKASNDRSVRWVDMTGKPRFDSNFNRLLGEDDLVLSD